MTAHYDVIYLSPHLDDAALSCGGQIALRTAVGGHKPCENILIVSIMAGDPPGGGFSDYAQELHGRWQLAHDAVAVRRAEDVAACALLGADYQHWAVPDCIYRLDPADGRLLYSEWAQIIGHVSPAEEALVAELAVQMASLPSSLRVVAPLAAGHHVDHQIVRRAAEICFGNRLAYYEDYPYVRDPQLLTAVIPPGDPGWEDEIIPLSQAAIQVKTDAIAVFASQVSTFFNGRDDLNAQILAYTNLVGGERLWRRKTAPANA